MAYAAALLAVPLVATTVEQMPDPDRVSPGFAGFAVIFLLALATVLLIRSMVGHLRKVRYLPEPPDPDVPVAQPATPQPTTRQPAAPLPAAPKPTTGSTPPGPTSPGR
jgi:hypothetical protein